MITTNIIQRVFQARFPNRGDGTCFTVEVDQKQYIITAKHLARDITGEGDLCVYWKGEWHTISVKLIGHSNNNVDISVLSANIQLSPTYSAVPDDKGLVYGQDVYFLGFPYLYRDSKFEEMNRGFPMPFVKKGIVSFMSESQLFLDGYNNPGFSGGPVIFKPRGKQEYQIAGVVSGYKYRNAKVEQVRGVPVSAYVRENMGIVGCGSIKDAVDMIKSWPRGFSVKCYRRLRGREIAPPAAPPHIVL